MSRLDELNEEVSAKIECDASLCNLPFVLFLPCPVTPCEGCIFSDTAKADIQYLVRILNE